MGAVNSELSEEFGIDDAPRKAGLNCNGLCIPPYPWGPEAGTTRRGIKFAMDFIFG